MTSLLSKIRAALRSFQSRRVGPPGGQPPAAAPPLTATRIARLTALAEMVAMTRDDEIDCDLVYDLVDRYAELVEQGQPASALLPRVKHHLELCAPCREEYEALLAILQHESP